jgi:hypothetical protein
VSATLGQIHQLVLDRNILISEHGYDELAADHISVRDVMDGFRNAILIEDYPDYHKGPCVLVLQKDKEQQPIHVVWGIPRGKSEPAVLITAYRPDPEHWDEKFQRRRT